MNVARPSSRNERRKKDFKKGIDADDARRKREDNIVQLRKDKRDENLQKKRAVFPASGVGGAIEESTRGGGSAAQKVVHAALFVNVSKLILTCTMSCSSKGYLTWCKASGVKIWSSRSTLQRSSESFCP